MKILTTIAIIILGCSCQSTKKKPNLNNIYSRAAKYNGLDRNPVIVIPGILGSKLKDSETGLRVWGAWDGEYANPNNAEQLRLISLPLDTTKPIGELSDSIVPDGALSKIVLKVFGIPIELEAYKQILNVLGSGGYRDQLVGESNNNINYGKDHFTCFQFDYDWRKSNVANAAELERFIIKKRKYVQKELEKRYGVKNHNVKFDIVAHSMGGLIARYFLRYGGQPLPENGKLPELNWAGRKHVDRTVLIATPNAGSVIAFNDLIKGTQLAPILPHYHAAILGSYPSLYELLPRPRHGLITENGKSLNIYDPQVWIDREWGLADHDQIFALKWNLADVTDDENLIKKTAKSQLKRILKHTQQFHRAIDLKVTPPKDFEISLVLGDSERTRASVSIDPQGNPHFSSHAPGDGVVVRTSALMDERLNAEWAPQLVTPIPWQNITFIFREHVELTQDESFADNILFYLLEKPR